MIDGFIRANANLSNFSTSTVKLSLQTKDTICDKIASHKRLSSHLLGGQYMKISESIRRRPFLLEFAVWVILALIVFIIGVVMLGIETEDEQGVALVGIGFILLAMGLFIPMLTKSWKRGGIIYRIALTVAMGGINLLYLLLGDVIRVLIVKRLYLGEKPLENAILSLGSSSVICGHCKGEGVCKQSPSLPGEQSCVSCLVAAGMSPNLKRLVKCSECRGTGKLVLQD